MLASAKMVAGGGGAGASVVKVELSKDLVARVISQADSNAVQIAPGAIADFAPTIPDASPTISAIRDRGKRWPIPFRLADSPCPTCCACAP